MLLRGRLHLAPSGRCNPRHRRRKSRRAFVRPGALPRLGTSPTASIYLPRSRSEGFSAILGARWQAISGSDEVFTVSTKSSRMARREGFRTAVGFVKRKDAKIWRPLVVQLDRRSEREGNDAICALCDFAALALGLSACSNPYDPAAVNWLVRLPRRSGRDLPLPKPSKGTTLCPQLPGIRGMSVEIHRCQDRIMRHQRDRRYRNERDSCRDSCQVQNSAQQLSRCA